MKNFYDMSKYPIYNADSIDPYGIASEEDSSSLMDLLEESANQTKRIQEDYALLVEKYNKLSDEYNKLAKTSIRLNEMYDSSTRDAIIMSRYIDDNVELNSYIEYLKSLKSNPKYRKYLREIEMFLADYGEDEETDNFINGGISANANY